MKLLHAHFLLAIMILGVIGCGAPQNQKETKEGKVSTLNSRVETLPYYGDPSFTPQWLAPHAKELDNFHRISAFSLLNQEGETLRTEDLRGKIYVADFFFTSCPGICPKMTSNMALLQEAFLEDPKVVLLSHSVTPERDSVPVLRAYAEDKGILAHKWHLLTGERQQIYSLGRNDYFIEEDLGVEKDVDDFLHTENFVLVDGNLHIRGIYNGLNKSDINQLIADIQTLKKEG
ncbi:MAG: SCO family protein [Saprospiraceae bacterium]|nr:SCO family protein [Saprospiraceae bacterium]